MSTDWVLSKKTGASPKRTGFPWRSKSRQPPNDYVFPSILERIRSAEMKEDLVELRLQMTGASATDKTRRRWERALNEAEAKLA